MTVLLDHGPTVTVTLTFDLYTLMDSSVELTSGQDMSTLFCLIYLCLISLSTLIIPGDKHNYNC